MRIVSTHAGRQEPSLVDLRILEAGRASKWSLTYSRLQSVDVG